MTIYQKSIIKLKEKIVLIIEMYDSLFTTRLVIPINSYSCTYLYHYCHMHN